MSEREAPLRVSLIGYGFAGRTFHAPLIQAVPGLSLDFVASRDAGKVHADLPDVEVIDDPMHAATDPRAAKFKAEDMVELRFVDEMRKSGFVDKLYGRTK